MDTIMIFNDEFKQYFRNKNYFISKNGEIYSKYSDKIIKKMLRGKNDKLYYYIDVYIDGRQKHIPVHRIVYETWVRPLNNGEQVNHIDDDALNNNLNNLYVGGQEDNIHDCIKNNHRCGNIFSLTVYDKEFKSVLHFCPANTFFDYSGHYYKSGGIKKMFSKNWFINRYDVIEYKRVKNHIDMGGVTTIPDECREVDRILSPVEAHRIANSYEEIV